MPCGCAKRREKGKAIVKAIAQKVKAAITRKEPKPSENAAEKEGKK